MLNDFCLVLWAKGAKVIQLINYLLGLIDAIRGEQRSFCLPILQAVVCRNSLTIQIRQPETELREILVSCSPQRIVDSVLANFEIEVMRERFLTVVLDCKPRPANCTTVSSGCSNLQQLFS